MTAKASYPIIRAYRLKRDDVFARQRRHFLLGEHVHPEQPAVFDGGLRMWMDEFGVIHPEVWFEGRPNA